MDDAEFMHDRTARPLARSAPSARSAADRLRSAPSAPTSGSTHEPDRRVRPARPGITVPFDGIPLHAHREWFARLRELGYTDIWSAEVDGADGFTPLALAAAWEPELNLGVAITPAYTRGPALLAQSLAAMADAAPGRFACGLGASSQVIVANWNGLLFENQYRRVRDTLRFLRMAFSGEKITEDFGTFNVKGFRLARIPEQLPPIYLAALRPGMLHLAGKEADGAILELAQRRGRRHVRGGGREGGRGGAPADRRPNLRHRHRGCGHGPDDRTAHDHRLPQRRGLRRVPTLARPGPGAPADVGRLGGRRPEGRARAAIPDEVVDDLVVHGSVDECRAHVQRYVDHGVTVPAPAVIPIGIDLAEAVAGLSPSAW